MNRAYVELMIGTFVSSCPMLTNIVITLIFPYRVYSCIPVLLVVLNIY